MQPDVVLSSLSFFPISTHVALKKKKKIKWILSSFQLAFVIKKEPLKMTLQEARHIVSHFPSQIKLFTVKGLKRIVFLAFFLVIIPSSLPLLSLPV